MNNRNSVLSVRLFGIALAVVVLMAGLPLTGCSSPTGDTGNGSNNSNGGNGNGGGIDSALNGTWFYIDEDEYIATVKFNNGNYEASLNDNPIYKGTYTTNNGKITLKVTQIHGSWYENLGFESRWYTNSEALTLFTKLDDIPEEIKNDMIKLLSTGATSNYSVTGSTFIMTSELGGETITETYTRK